MTFFDKIFFFIFTHFKTTYKQKANSIALFFTSVLQIALLFLLGCFLAAFLSQMHVSGITSTKAWTAFVLLSIGLHFKNWMTYSGQTRKVLNAKWNKIKAPKYNLMLLFALPLIAIILAVVLLQAT